MLTPSDLKLARALRTWIVNESDRLSKIAIHGMEEKPYLKAVARHQALMDFMKEIDSLEAEIRADR